LSYHRRVTEPKDVRETLGANIRRVRRNVREMSGREFISRLEARGVKLLPSGLTALEKGDRRVTAEELLVIAQVLNTSVVDLLMPGDGSALKIAEGVAALEQDEQFYWLRGDQPWPGADRAEFAEAANEQNRYMLKLFDSVHVKALSALADNVRIANQPEIRRLIDPGLLARGIRTSLEDVNQVVGELASSIEAGEGGPDGR
jgi:transcriptional regulator with XRE-family HTH domain